MLEILIAGLFFGLIGFFVGGVVVTQTPNIHRRCCINCAHCSTQPSKSGNYHRYCDLAPGESYPVDVNDYCGKFEFTEQLKAEQVRRIAEKLVK